jgi:hypothetical protein
MPNKAPIFIEQPFLWTASLTAQTLTRDGVTGAGVLLGTASGSGAIVESIWCIPQGNFSQNVCRLFIQKAGIATNILVRELTIPAEAAASNTAAVAIAAFQLPDVLSPTGSFGLRLNPSDRLYAALGTASGIALQVLAMGGHYELT